MLDIKVFSSYSDVFVSPLFPEKGGEVSLSIVFSEAPDGVLLRADGPSGYLWSYPMEHDTWTDEEELREETIFNMVSSMLLRIHLSGHLVKLDDLRKTLVKDGIAVYKKIRPDIPHMLPFWPLGPASYQDEWIAFGLKSKECAYLAVWKRKMKDSEGNEAQEIREIQIPLPEEFVRTAAEEADAGMEISVTDVRCIYPSGAEKEDLYSREEHTLRIRTKKPFMARLFRITAAKAEEQLEEK